jgi:hypothetical protein
MWDIYYWHLYSLTPPAGVAKPERSGGFGIPLASIVRHCFVNMLNYKIVMRVHNHLFTFHTSFVDLK